MKSLDRRYLKTEKVILDSMVSLLNQKRFEDIQIEDVCLRADINKSTFYLHYQSLYFLLSSLEDSFLSSMEKLLYEKSDSPIEEIVSFLVSFAKDNKKTLAAIFKANDYRFNEKVRNIFIPLLSLQPSQKKKFNQDYLNIIGLIDGVLALFRAFVLEKNKMTNEDFISLVLCFFRGVFPEKTFD